jgi:hypothetical protein
MRTLVPLICLAATACLPPRVMGPSESFDDPRARALADARQGMGIRLQATSAETIEGQLVAVSDATITVASEGAEREVPIASVALIHLNRDYSAAMIAGGASAGALRTVTFPFGLLSLSLNGGILGAMATGWTAIGAGLGMTVAGLAGGWQQVFPDRIHPERWLTPARMSAGQLTGYVRLERTAVEDGDSLRAFVDLVNAGHDSVDVLERACGPLVVVVGPARQEWVAPCRSGLRVVRVGPGRLTREVTLPTRLPTGPYQVEYRVIRLAPGRDQPFDTAGAVRFAARGGMIVR